MFELFKTEGKARRGVFTCAHGTVQTPVFMNVGTQAAIKGGLSAKDLKDIGCQVELSNTYHLHLRPGDKLVKEPFVRNTGYYDQYIRVTVTISDATAWINALGLDFAIENVFAGYDASKWSNISKAIEGETDTITYVLYYTGILDGADTANDAVSGTANQVTLFTHVNIPQSLTQAQAAAFKGDFSIDIKAEAVQTENVGANAYEAFATVGAIN